MELPWERLRRLGDDVLRSDANHLGQLCLEEGLITAGQLDDALRAWADQESDAVVPLGVVLMRRGHLSVGDLARMLRRQAERNPGLPAGEVDAALLEAERDPERCVGKFVLVEAVGEGGMGKVWRAWERPLRRWVALKFLKHDSAQHRDRFLREAELAARLSHPNILPIYELGRDPRGGEERNYISMPYVEGRILGAGALEPREAAATVRTVAEAVHAAHEQGVLHRDLKPQNLIVEKGGRVYVMDFGLAKRITVDEPVTVSKMLLGTPAYMSPEQARGEAVDRRADVYSLGATLYHLLAGRPPFAETSILELLQAVQSDEAPRLRPGIDRDLEAICLKAMEKSPSRRYSTAADLAADLGRYLAGEPTIAHPPSAAARAARRLRRHPAAVLAALLLLAGAAVPAVRYVRARGHGDRGMARLAEGRLADARVELEQALASWNRADWRDAVARIDAAERAARDVSELRLQYRELYIRLAPDIARAEAIGFNARPKPGEAEALLERVERVLGALPEPWSRTSLPHAYRGWVLCNLGRRDEGMAELQKSAEIGGLQRGDPYGLMFRARFLAHEAVYRMQLASILQQDPGGVLADLRAQIEPILSWPGWAEAREAEHFVTWLKAAERFAQGGHAEAARLFETILEAPEFGDEALMMAGASWGMSGDLDAMGRCMETLVERRPEWVRAWASLAYALMMKGEHVRAAEAFEHAISIGAADVLLLRYRAQCLMDEADRIFGTREDSRDAYRRAIAAFDDAIRVNDTYSRAFHERGLCHQRLGIAEALAGDLEAAKACGERALVEYDRALELNPKLWQSHQCRGLVLEMMQRPKPALAAFEAALELAPDDPEVLASIKRVRAKLGAEEF